MTILYLIRHGETAGNSEGRFQGIVDNPLNESGMQQSQMLGMAFSLSRVDVLYTSPLLRARQTAQMIAQMHGLQKLEPVVEPVAQILTLTPICTHNMRFSSYVLSPDHTLTVSFERNGRKPIFLFVDESRAFPLHSNDIVQIRRSRYLTRLAHLSEKSFCEVFAQKMLPGGFQS